VKRTFTAWCAVIAASVSSAAPVGPHPSAPPLKCEIGLSSWCIVEGAYEITRHLANDSVHDRVWSLRGRFSPRSRMLVLEPNGCRSLYSDALLLVAFEKNVQWQGETWDRLRVRLDNKGRCDLEVLLVSDVGDPLEWAFTEGLSLIRTCREKACGGPSLAELKPTIEARFRGQR